MDKYALPIERQRLSIRAQHCLRRSGIDTVGQVLDLGEDDLLSIRNLGRRGFEEIQAKIIRLALDLPPYEELE